ncbi:neuropeptide-like protein 31 [Penaeus vannamei]|uniref:neuropeptide-like protein 31 n=1 Tax=Penaeus vannamei TaxID=6689 RepID=UPI00387F9B0A
MKLLSMALALIVALTGLLGWTSAMPDPEPVADPSRFFGGGGGYGHHGGSFGRRSFGTGSFGRGSFGRGSFGRGGHGFNRGFSSFGRGRGGYW